MDLPIPWPWYVAGATIGLVVTLLQWIGARQFGVSANFRHLCAIAGSRLACFRYDWRRDGRWNLLLAGGLVLGGFVAANWLRSAPPTFAPATLVSWTALGTWPGIFAMVVGGFLVGFGARWAGGCTSGHAISGLSTFQWPSLLAVVGFFAGGLIVTWLVLPWML
ncbi:MAG TPA: YeeE/YedE thiosulfate transporter family protein [Vicinamibacterales bacterium]|nr:YeeE/YedE thiosulfate transporter family protein [Vicinamibacterales bacterium]